MRQKLEKKRNKKDGEVKEREGGERERRRREGEEEWTMSLRFYTILSH